LKKDKIWVKTQKSVLNTKNWRKITKKQLFALWLKKMGKNDTYLQSKL